LTPNLGLLTPYLEDELGKAVKDLFPEEANHGWTEVELYPLLLSLTACTSAKAFVGTSFCRDSRWLNSAVNFVEDRALPLPPFLRRKGSVADTP
jgi:hypothetical protein